MSKTEQDGPNLKNVKTIVLALFGVGFIPYAPGTFASIATLPIVYLIFSCQISLPILITAVIAVTFFCGQLANAAQKIYHSHDPSWIVIDEFLGMLVAGLFLNSGHWTHLLVILIFFRIFDISKIWPANYFDSKVEHGLGIMLDDIVAGVYSGISYLLFFRLLKFIS